MDKTKLVHEDSRLTQFANKVQQKLFEEILYQKLILSYVEVTSDFEVEPDTAPALLVNSSLGDINITLFNSDKQKNDNKVHRFWIYHSATSNPVNIVTITVDGQNFSDGLEAITIQPGETLQFGSIYDDTESGWMRIDNQSNVEEISREAAWDAANFDSAIGGPAAIPFDQLNAEDNPYILKWDNPDNVTDIIVGLKGRVLINYNMVLASTGGAAIWNVSAWVELNGSELNGTRSELSGLLANNPASMSLTRLAVEVEKDDILTLVIQQTNLTGNLVHANFGIQRLSMT